MRRNHALPMFAALTVLVVTVRAGAQQPTKPEHHHHHHAKPAPAPAPSSAPASPSAGEAGVPTPPASSPAAAAGAETTSTPVAEPAAAPGKKRLAVLVVPETGVEPELADDVNDVLIAAIGRKGGFTFEGNEEFAAKVGRDPREALSCVSDVACLSRAGVALGVEMIVAGTVAREGSDHTVGISLIDISTGQVVGRIYKMVPGGPAELVKVLQEGANKLFEPKIPPGNLKVASEVRGAHVYVDDAFIGTAPVRTPDLEAGPHTLRIEAEGHMGFERTVDVKPGDTLEIDIDRAALPERPAWPRYTATVLAATAVAAAGVGAVFGFDATRNPPGGADRQQIVDVSLASKEQEAHIANGLLIGAGACAAAAGVILVLHWHDIFGDVQEVQTQGPPPAAEKVVPNEERNTASREPTLGMAPLPGGAFVQGGFSF